jgi:hypothetical protein
MSNAIELEETIPLRQLVSEAQSKKKEELSCGTAIKMIGVMIILIIIIGGFLMLGFLLRMV